VDQAAVVADYRNKVITTEDYDVGQPMTQPTPSGFPEDRGVSYNFWIEMDYG